MKKIFVIVFLLGMNQAVLAENFKILPKPEKISKHVYAWIGPYGGPNVENKGYRMNLAFVVGTKSIAVLDSGFYPAMASEMIAHIKTISPLPVKYVINSNSQPDRFLGNDVFRKTGAVIITSPKEAERMEENGNNYAMMLEMRMKFKPDDIKLPEHPTRIITQKTDLDLGGGVTVTLHMYKAAHTPQPLIVHIPGDKVVYAGDILYSGRMLSVVEGSNIRQWIQTYDYLRRFTGDTFIPGHGKPGPLSAFEKSTYQYLLLLDAHMTKMVAEEKGMQEAILRLDQSSFSKLENYKDLAGRNAHRAYLEAELAAFD
ncbi:SoxH protein, homolog [hydrothermal vent metagenome]|uniref:SoxH protein, homolog n=1 Tax=hydrothermal vent metagenome TaxID=652676 RepID=A0A3B0ZHF6_9ZZZZ